MAVDRPFKSVVFIWRGKDVNWIDRGVKQGWQQNISRYANSGEESDRQAQKIAADYDFLDHVVVQSEKRQEGWVERRYLVTPKGGTTQIIDGPIDNWKEHVLQSGVFASA